MGRSKCFIYEVSQAYTHRKWDDDTGMTDHHRSVRLILQKLDIQLQTDDKHKKDQAQLTEKIQIGQRCWLEYELTDFWQEVAEDLWTKQNTSNHLADNLWLANSPHQGGEQL